MKHGGGVIFFGSFYLAGRLEGTASMGFPNVDTRRKTFQKGRRPILQAELSKRLPGPGLVDF
jgi:hypothetical protein